MNVFGGYSLVAGSTGQQRPTIVTANVSSNRPLPTSYSDPLYVVEPWMPDHYRKIVQWLSVGGMPTAGQACTLIREGRNGQWYWNAIVWPQ